MTTKATAATKAKLTRNEWALVLAEYEVAIEEFCAAETEFGEFPVNSREFTIRVAAWERLDSVVEKLADTPAPDRAARAEKRIICLNHAYPAVAA
jgi:hypothetical protein